MGFCIHASLLVISAEFLIFIFKFKQNKTFSSQLARQDLSQYVPNSWLIWPDLSHIISTNNCMWILTACFSGSLKFYSLCLNAPLHKRFSSGETGCGAVWSSCSKFTAVSFLCSSQRPQPQGGAAVWQRERWSHAESPELFHFKSTPQSLLPGRGGSQGGGESDRGVRSDHQEGNQEWWSEGQQKHAQLFSRVSNISTLKWMKPIECIMNFQSIYAPALFFGYRYRICDRSGSNYSFSFNFYLDLAAFLCTF